VTIKARILADSISPTKKRLVTFELTYPRFIHAEFMTHRVFSRNAASSRAIPFKKLLQRIIDDPAIPIHWGLNQPGMQAAAELAGSDRADAHQIWLRARDAAVEQALKLERLNVHKQVINRLLEPWMHITIIASATDRDNFYSLRYHPAAEPHFQTLAKVMWEAEQESTPRCLDYGEWHLPLLQWDDEITYDLDAQKKISAGRCARITYLNHDGTNPVAEKDIELHDKLLVNGHMSPFEHQATPLEQDCENTEWAEVQSGNFLGWLQYRKTLPNENRTSFIPPS
jgi:thymidylate synthase ThyX